MSCQDVCLYEDAETQALAEALGAVAAGPAATFWLYADGNGQWHVQREGDAEDHQFDKRDEALNFVRVSAARSPCHRLISRAPRNAVSTRRLSSPARDGAGPSHGWWHRLTGWWHAGHSQAGTA